MRMQSFAIAGVLVFGLAACASSPQPTSSPSGVTSSATASPSGSVSDASGITVSTTLGTKPTVGIPSAFTSTDHLIVRDIVPGTGAAVQPTDNVTVNYVGIGAETKQQFDASWDAHTTASFPLSGVIQGWQQGLVGMKVGGRRLLVIPGALAYGANAPAGSGIKPNETLIFVVDLVSIP